MLAAIRAGLVARFDPKLVDELIEAYTEAKRNYYLGGLRLGAVEGGRFSEAAFRMLQQLTTGKWDSLGKQLDSEATIKALAQLGAASLSDSVRLHIPRTLRVVYDIRNKRDAAHLGDGIDPNLQDASLVVASLDWVMAEFVRLFHNVGADEAQRIVEQLVTRAVPAVEDIKGFQKVLRTSLGVSDRVLLLLYARGAAGGTRGELESWLKPPMRKNLSRTMRRLEHDSGYVHRDNGTYLITASGIREVERRRLFEMPS